MPTDVPSPASSPSSHDSASGPDTTAPHTTAPVTAEPTRPAPAPPRRSGTLYDLFVETFAVVLGILLALLVNDWQAGRADAARAAQARASIVDELRANRALVADSRAYHRTLLDSLGARRGGSRGARPSRPSPRLFARGFVHPAATTSTAWQSAASTGAVALFDYADVLTLSRVYAAQDTYRESSRTTGQILYQALYATGTEGVAGDAQRLVPLIAASMYLEDRLVADLDSTLAALARPDAR